jgi:hypothetical protein
LPRPDLLVEENDELAPYTMGMIQREERETALAETAKQFEAAQPPPEPVEPEKELDWIGGLDILKEGFKGLVRGATETLQAATSEAAENLSGTVLPAWPGNPLGKVNDAIDAAQEATVGASPTSVAGAVVGPVAQFVGGAGPLKLLGAGKVLPQGVSKAAKVARMAGAGSLTGALAFDPHEERLSDLIQRFPGAANPVTEFLASNETDSKALGRLKSGIENAGVGVALGATLGALARGVKRFRVNQVPGEVPVPEELLSAANDVAVARAAVNDSRTAIGKEIERLKAENERLASGAPAEPGRTKEQMYADQASARLEKAKEIKEEMKAIRAEKEAAWEVIKKSPLYTELPERTRAYLDAHVEGREATLSRVPTEALQIEEGTRAIKRIANDLDRGFDERALEEIKLGRPASDVLGSELGKVFNVGKMDLSSDDTLSILDTLAKWAKPVMDKSTGGAVRTFEQSSDLINRILGSNPEEVVARAGEIARNVERAGEYMQAVESMAITAADQIAEMAKRLANTPPSAVTPEMEGELLQAISNTQTLMTVVKGIQKGAARATSLRRLRKGFNPDHVRLDIVDSIIGDVTGGRAGLRRLARRIAAADGDRAAVLRTATELPSRGKRTANAIREYFVNNLLYGPVTQTVNSTGTSLMALYDPIEQAIHFGMETGSPKAALKELQVVYGSIAETSLLTIKAMAAALHLAPEAVAPQADSFARAIGFDPKVMPQRVWRAFRTERAQLTDLAASEISREKAITGANFAAQGGTIERVFGEQFAAASRLAIDWIGHGVRVPTRLMTGTDEFAANTNFFAHLRREAYRLGTRKGLTGDALKNYMNNFVDNADAHTLAVVRDKALETAKRNVFQAPLEGNLKGLQVAIGGHTVPALLIPFFRTPINLFKYGFNRHPAVLVAQGLLSSEVGAPRFFSAWRNGTLNEALKDPKVADFAARWFTASMMTAAAGFAVQSGRITGRGPSDPNARRAWEGEGYQPYSVRIMGKWINYGRLDPFGIILGTMADVITEMSEANAQGFTENAEALVMANVMSLSSTLKSRNYLQGLMLAVDAFTDTDGDKWGLFGRKFLGGFVPAGALLQHANATLDLGGLLNADPTMMEPREYDAAGQVNQWKSLGNALDMRAGMPEGGPFGAITGSQGAVRQWSVFGPMKADYGLGSDFLSPLKAREVRATPFAKALSRARVSPVITNDIRAINGHQLNREETEAFGELVTTMKLKGLTLEEAGNLLVRSPQFEALPDYADDSAEFETKQKMLRRLIGEYRKQAGRALLLDQRHPERGQRYVDAKLAARTPDTLTQLIELSRKR